MNQKSKLFIIAISLILMVGAGCAKKVARTDNPFFVEKIPGVFEDLTVKDLPSVYTRSHIAESVEYKGKWYLAASPYVLVYEQDGDLVEISDRSQTECEYVFSLAVINDTLYVGCQEDGIYEVDMSRNEMVYKYDQSNGMKSVTNLDLAVDRETLWVGTFDGLTKIDTRSREVSFYDDELGIDAEKYGSVYPVVVGGDVWVRSVAHNFSRGGVSRYNPSTDTWIAFNVRDFKTRGGFDRIDFDKFIVSSKGVFAQYRDGSGIFALAKFEEGSNSFKVIKEVDNYEDSEVVLGDLLPPAHTYLDKRAILDDGEKQLQVYKGGSWKTIPIHGRSYYAMTDQDQDVYFMRSSYGLERLERSDSFPQKVARIRLEIGDPSFITFSPDKRYVIAGGFEQSDYFGDLSGYNFFVYDRQDGDSFESHVEDSEGEFVFELTKIEVTDTGEGIGLDIGIGKNFVIKPNAEVISIEK